METTVEHTLILTLTHPLNTITLKHPLTRPNTLPLPLIGQARERGVKLLIDMTSTTYTRSREDAADSSVLHSSIHTYIHTYIHAYIYPYIHPLLTNSS